VSFITYSDVSYKHRDVTVESKEQRSVIRFLKGKDSALQPFTQR